MQGLHVSLVRLRGMRDCDHPGHQKSDVVFEKLSASSIETPFGTLHRCRGRMNLKSETGAPSDTKMSNEEIGRYCKRYVQCMRQGTRGGFDERAVKQCSDELDKKGLEGMCALD